MHEAQKCNGGIQDDFAVPGSTRLEVAIVQGEDTRLVHKIYPSPVKRERFGSRGNQLASSVGCE